MKNVTSWSVFQNPVTYIEIIMCLTGVVNGDSLVETLDWLAL